VKPGAETYENRKDPAANRRQRRRRAHSESSVGGMLKQPGVRGPSGETQHRRQHTKRSKVLRVKIQDRKCKPGVRTRIKEKSLSKRQDSCTGIKIGAQKFLTEEVAKRPGVHLAQIESKKVRGGQRSGKKNQVANEE
jgi:hypothetical protein